VNWKKTLLAAAVLSALGGFAVSQTIVQQNVTGNECWNAGQGPGGTSTGFICTYLMRNGAAIATFSGSGAFTTQATPQQSTLYWVSTAPTTWTITTPVTPFDGEIISIGTDTTLTTMVTLTAASGQTLNSAYSSQTLSANASVEYQYSVATTKWYRLR